MKDKLDSLIGQKVWIFVEMTSVYFHIVGTLKGGQLPGQPYGVHIEQPDGSFDMPQADISFKPENVTKYNYTNHTHTFKIG